MSGLYQTSVALVFLLKRAYKIWKITCNDENRIRVGILWEDYDLIWKIFNFYSLIPLHDLFSIKSYNTLLNQCTIRQCISSFISIPIYLFTEKYTHIHKTPKLKIINEAIVAYFDLLYHQEKKFTVYQNNLQEPIL